MKNKKNMIFILILMAFLLNYKVHVVYNKVDLIDEIINKTHGQVVEYGFKTRFKSEINGQELSKYFINEINAKEGTKVKIEESKGNYYINFIKEKLTGSINITNYNGENIVELEAIGEGSYNMADSLKNEFDPMVKKISKNQEENYKYLRVKLYYKDLVKVDKEIIDLLKSKGSKNINTLKIQNGFTTSAYTNLYNPKKTNGKLIDLNYALCNYSSGNYLIIGTPEIFTSY